MSSLPLRLEGLRSSSSSSHTPVDLLALPLSCDRIKTPLSFIAVWSDLIASLSSLLMFDFGGFEDEITPHISALRPLVSPPIDQNK